MSNSTGMPLVSCVSEVKESVFLDFNQNDTQSFWRYNLNKLQQQCPFDGLQLSHNEISTLISSELPSLNNSYFCTSPE